MDSLQIQVNHLEEKDIKKETKIGEQEKEIIKLKTKMNAKLESNVKTTGLSHDDLITEHRSSNDNNKSSDYIKEGSQSGD